MWSRSERRRESREPSRGTSLYITEYKIHDNTATPSMKRKKNLKYFITQ